MSLKKNLSTKSDDERLSPADEQAKVKALRAAIGPLSGRAAQWCNEACLIRYLKARSWNVKKAEKMLRETLSWRATYKPEEIRWEEVAKESETGKVYRADFTDKIGRSVLVMRPANQNTKDQVGQIRHLVYMMESAIMNLTLGNEQMVWLIDFKGWSMKKTVPVSLARETAYILQNMYPERLALAVLYDTPRVFEAFWVVVKPFLDPKTAKKVKFVYTKTPETSKIVQEFFDLDKLETAFGGRNISSYDHVKYGVSAKQNDQKTAGFWKSADVADISTLKLDSQEPQVNGESEIAP